MPPILSKEEMDAMDSRYDSDNDPRSMEMLEDNCDGSQSHLSVNIREERYKLRDHITQRQSEWIWALKATQNMGNCLHKVFKTSVNDILQDLSPLGESG